jgi:hypothetical protein
MDQLPKDWIPIKPEMYGLIEPGDYVYIVSIEDKTHKYYVWDCFGNGNEHYFKLGVSKYPSVDKFNFVIRHSSIQAMLKRPTIEWRLMQKK